MGGTSSLTEQSVEDGGKDGGKERGKERGQASWSRSWKGQGERLSSKVTHQLSLHGSYGVCSQPNAYLARSPSASYGHRACSPSSAVCTPRPSQQGGESEPRAARLCDGPARGTESREGRKDEQLRVQTLRQHFGRGLSGHFKQHEKVGAVVPGISVQP